MRVAGAATLSRRDEAPLDGWNATGVVEDGPGQDQGGSYSFLYAVDPEPVSQSSTTAAASPSQLLAVKALAVGPALLVNMLADPAPESTTPETLELNVDHFTSPAPDAAAAASYCHMDDLVARVQKGLATQVKRSAQQGATSTAAAPASTTSGQAAKAPGQVPAQGQGQGREEEEFDPLRDYSQPSRGVGGGIGPMNPLMVGAGDLMPGGWGPSI